MGACSLLNDAAQFSGVDKMTNEEKRLLEKLSLGEFDGVVGNCLSTQGGSTIWTVIKDGVPKRIKQGLGVDSLTVRKTSISLGQNMCLIVGKLRAKESSFFASSVG